MTDLELVAALAEKVREALKEQEERHTAEIAEIREQLKAVPAAGRDGKDGRDGRDGKDGIASLDQMKALVDETVTARLEAEVQKRVGEAVGALPTLQYRGVFKEGEAYRAGDCATFAGSIWHANQPTTEKPGDGSEAWTLAVKRGRDGRDAR